MMLAIAEGHGGNLDIAYGLAREAQHLGDEAEQLRAAGHDLQALVEFAMGGRSVTDLRTPLRSISRGHVGDLPLPHAVYCLDTRRNAVLVRTPSDSDCRTIGVSAVAAPIGYLACRQ
jgi:hypothetical protein